MKIAILTYHYGYNEGTLLQAYAVQRLLDQQFGDGSSFIADHRYPTKEAVVFPKPCNNRELALREFFDRHLRLSDFHNYSDNSEPTWRYIAENFDFAVVGSDELWRVEYSWKSWFFFSTYRQTNPWAPAFPNVYWPDAGKLGIPCISLAASISEKDRVCDIPKAHRRLIAQSLGSFSLITVRDSRTKTFIEGVLGCGSCKCSWLPDPTFSLDPPSEKTLRSVENVLRKTGVNPLKKKALIISHTSSAALRRAMDFFRQHDYTIICATYNHPESDIDLSQKAVGPFEWAALSCFADVVITDRFHGAVFALRNGPPIIGLDYRGQQSGNDSKMKDLFKRFEIEDYWFPVESNNDAQLYKILVRVADGDWPKERMVKVCQDFQKKLENFASGPLAALAPSAYDLKGKKKHLVPVSPVQS